MASTSSFNGNSRMLLRALLQICQDNSARSSNSLNLRFAVPRQSLPIARSSALISRLSSRSFHSTSRYRSPESENLINDATQDSSAKTRSPASVATEKDSNGLKHTTNNSRQTRKSASSKRRSETSQKHIDLPESTPDESRLERKHEPWFLYKQALKQKFPEGWNPRKKISPDAMEGMRALHAQYPEECTREVLGNMFKISQEAVRRILKAKPKHPAMEARIRERWAKRHDNIWDNMSEIGLRPKRTKSQSPDENTFTMPPIDRKA